MWKNWEKFKEKESPGIPHPRDSGVSSVNRSVDVGRSCLLYSTKEQNTNTFRVLHTLPTLGNGCRGWPPSPKGPARPAAITTLPSILHSPLTNLSLHYVFSPNFRPFPSGMFPRVQSAGQKVRTCMMSLWHRLQVSILFFPLTILFFPEHYYNSQHSCRAYSVPGPFSKHFYVLIPSLE